MKSNGDQSLPLWDLDPVYPGFESAKYRDAKESVRRGIAALGAEIGRPKGTKPADWLASVLARYNEVSDLYEDLFAYAYSSFTVDTRDERAQREVNQLEEIGLPLKQAIVAFRNALAEIGANLEAMVAADSRLAEYGFFLREQLELQKHQMSPLEEDLAADLSRAGGDAWSRLQEAVSSNLSVEWDAGTTERKTVVQLRTLAFNPDRSVRERAFRKELEAWKSMEIPLAYALNGVKGFSVTLNGRRGFESTLERSTVQARITRATLDSLISVMKESLPLFRRYLTAKARALGLPKLAFFDIFAPVAAAAGGRKSGAGPGGAPAHAPGGEWPFDRARDFIIEQFDRFSPQVGAFAKRAFDQRWIDARPREGKVGGAYCVTMPLTKSSRILANFSNDFYSLSTIGHELGHAYHHEVLKEAPAIHRQYPMTLAETASIFSESLIYTSALNVVPPEQQVTILEDFLQNCTQVIVDILSRFIFENAVFERRASGELSPNELCELMIAAQKETYGEALDERELHPYMWAVKGHYYSQDLGYYNFPYAFGQLFGLGLFSLYEREGAPFAKRYRELLALTGRASAVDVTKSVGFDIERPEFWRSGIAMIGQRIERFIELVG